MGLDNLKLNEALRYEDQQARDFKGKIVVDLVMRNIRKDHREWPMQQV